MDALWNLEDKWKLTTQDAIAFLACTTFLVIALCIATILSRRAKRKASSLVHQEPCMDEQPPAEGNRPNRPQLQQRSWGCVKRALMSSVRWSGARKWEESHGERPTPLLVSSARYEVNVGRQSHNSTSPVWQRPILMGEKCELPRFSGLILYDERGRPLHQREIGATDYQEESATAVRTTLRDFL